MRMNRLGGAIGAALSCLTILSGCQGLMARGDDLKLSQAIEAIRQAQAGGEVGSVGGSLFLSLTGVFAPLQDWPVQLVPLTPTLEGAIRNAHEAYRRNERRPLSATELSLVRRSIGRHIAQLQRTGNQGLILTVKTNKTDEPAFTFTQVPQGRWLLLSHLTSEASLLLWAVPVTVRAGQESRQTLNDQTIWLEGFLSPTDRDAQPSGGRQP